MIDFKTYEEQIEILKSRGLSIDDENYAKKFLTINNYYNVINAYKSLFIEKGFTPEKYTTGATFEEIEALHKFDKDLRIIFSNILIRIERTIKSITAYEFTSNHPNHDLDYLDVNSYNAQHSTAVTELINVLNEEFANATHYNDEMICHYKNKYGRIPLWVFINKLSFGTISKMYKVLKLSDKDKIAKSIGLVSNKILSAKDVLNAMKILVYLRNKTAHDQIIYNYSSAPTTVSNNNDFIKTYCLSNVHSLFGAIACVSIFVDKNEFDLFIKQIKNLINTLFLKIHSIPTKELLNQMGIPQSFLR